MVIKRTKILIQIKNFESKQIIIPDSKIGKFKKFYRIFSLDISGSMSDVLSEKSIGKGQKCDSEKGR